MYALRRTLLKEDADGLDDDSEIDTEAGVLDVDEVVDELIVRGRIVLSVDLCKPCDAGFDIHSIYVFWNFLFELFDKKWTLRARSDERHITAQHIP